MIEDIRNELVGFIDSISRTADITETVCAMLNRHNAACIYICAEDSDITPEAVSSLFHAVVTRITPMVIPVISLRSYNGRNMIIIDAEGNDTPYSTDGRYLIRSKDVNIRIDPSELKDYFVIDPEPDTLADTITLTVSQRKVLDAIKADPAILTRDLVTITGLKISRINQVIRELKDAGKLQRIGSNKSGYWRIIE